MTASHKTTFLVGARGAIYYPAITPPKKKKFKKPNSGKNPKSKLIPWGQPEKKKKNWILDFRKKIFGSSTTGNSPRACSGLTLTIIHHPTENGFPPRPKTIILPSSHQKSENSVGFCTWEGSRGGPGRLYLIFFFACGAIFPFLHRKKGFVE